MTTATPRYDRPRQGSYSVRGKRKHPLGWLPWAALALMALLAAATYLVVTNVTDERDEEGIDLTDDETGTDPGGAEDRSVSGAASTGEGDAGSGTGTGAGSAAAGSQGGAGSAGGGQAAAPGQGTLTAGSTALLPVPQGGLSAATGQAVQGRGVRVESVVSDEGFWVGSSATDRVFVFLTPQARTTAGESPFQVEAGQVVDLAGTLSPAPDPAQLGVDPAEGAEQLRSQGQIIEATQLTLAG